MLVTATCLLNGDYIFFACQLPLALYHGRLLLHKTYKTYAITHAEYKSTHKKKVKELKIKLAIYIVLLGIATIILLINSGNMLAYHLFGKILINMVKK